MRISSPLRISMTFFVAAAIYGCAQSEPWDIDILQPDAGGQSGGMTGSGTGGDSSSSGGIQGTGAGGTGDVGSGGSNGNGGGIGTGGITTGSGGFTGTGGTTGTGGLRGTGGTTGTGGRGTGGTTGTGGIKGTGGVTGTGGVKGTGGTTGTGGTGGAAPTFTQIYTQILVVYCAGSQCHDPGSASGVAFSTQSSAYTSVSKYVTAGNGAGSSLYKTLSSGAMPQGKPKLSAANLALVQAWIDAGALNN
jgi:hypothetical protein